MFLALMGVAGPVEILLVVLEAVWPHSWGTTLPLGGSHIAQLGVVFGGMFALWQLTDVVRTLAAPRNKSKRSIR